MILGLAGSIIVCRKPIKDHKFHHLTEEEKRAQKQKKEGNKNRN